MAYVIFVADNSYQQLPPWFLGKPYVHLPDSRKKHLGMSRKSGIVYEFPQPFPKINSCH